MATPDKKKALSERMKAKPATPAPAAQDSVAGSFKAPAEEYPKRLTLDLTVAQHRKLKVLAMDQGTSMNQMLRDYIEDLT